MEGRSIGMPCNGVDPISAGIIFGRDLLPGSSVKREMAIGSELCKSDAGADNRTTATSEHTQSHVFSSSKVENEMTGAAYSLSIPEYSKSRRILKKRITT